MSEAHLALSQAWVTLGIRVIGIFRSIVVSALFASAPALASDLIPLDGATAEACFTPGADCASSVAHAISTARSRVWLLGYGFTETRIVNALRDASRRGADVRLILDRSNVDGGMRSVT